MGHPVPDTITGLLALLRPAQRGNDVEIATAPGVTGARVFDGPPIGGIDEPDAIGIGLSAIDIATAIGQSRPGWGGAENETFDLTCLIQCWSGDVELAPRRNRAYELFSAFRTLLAANARLGGACDRARIARHTYRALQGQDGAMALLEFTVRVEARRFEGV